MENVLVKRFVARVKKISAPRCRHLHNCSWHNVSVGLDEKCQVGARERVFLPRPIVKLRRTRPIVGGKRYVKSAAGNLWLFWP